VKNMVTKIIAWEKKHVNGAAASKFRKKAGNTP